MLNICLQSTKSWTPRDSSMRVEKINILGGQNTESVNQPQNPKKRRKLLIG